MMEIFVVIWLCRKNRKNAQMRGYKGGAHVAFTWILWFGFEVLGFIIGTRVGLGMETYLLALVLAVTGGLISYGFAKIGEADPELAAQMAQAAQKEQEASLPGMVPLPDAGWMEEPVPLTIVRIEAYVGSMFDVDLVLNGKPIGILSNGSEMTVYTQRLHNVIINRNAPGLPPFYFSVVPGESAEIHLRGVQFQPRLCIGCTPIAPAAVAALLAQQPPQPPEQ